MAGFLAFMAGPLGALAKIVIEGILIILVLGGLYWVITSKATENQALKDQKVILENVVSNQNIYIKKTDELQKLQQESSDTLSSKIQEIKDGNEELKNYLNNPTTVKDDRPSSEILRRTIKSLSGEK